MSAGIEAVSPDRFRPLQRTAAVELPSRAPASLWAHLRRRLRGDPRAWFGGSVVLLMVLAASAGPWLWPRDPALQNPTRSSLGPVPALEVRLVAEEGAWQAPRSELPERPSAAPSGGGSTLQTSSSRRPVQPSDQPSDQPAAAADLAAVQDLRAVEAHTEWVRLRWEPVPGARGYHIYRNTHEPRNRSDLGLPLGETRSGEEVGFEDRLRLRPHTWYYSVVASDGVEESARYSVLAVDPEPALLLLTAQLQELVPLNAQPEQWLGRTVTLPAHPLGTDYLGRDMLARLLHGARTSLFIGIVAPLLFVLFGTVYGASAGLVGGRLDNAMMRVADFVVALPFLLFMILLRVAFGIGPGESGVVPLLVAMLLLSWPASARLVRGQVLQLREEPFIDAARLAGAGHAYLIYRHLLPNVLGVVLVALTFAIPSAIFTEAFLSFIGMGVTPPTASWGSMSNDGMRTLLTEPHELLAPAACISITVLAFNLLGDALRDALDARLEPGL